MVEPPPPFIPSFPTPLTALPESHLPKPQVPSLPPSMLAKKKKKQNDSSMRSLNTNYTQALSSGENLFPFFFFFSLLRESN